MKMSTKGRYGLRVMIELALNLGQGPILTETIAKNQQISEKYIHLLVRQLKDSGLIKAARGRNGGYFIAREPDEITVLEVVNAMEGKITVVECTSNSAYCDRDDCCIARDLWTTLSEVIEEALEKVTIGELARQQAGLLRANGLKARGKKEAKQFGAIQ